MNNYKEISAEELNENPFKLIGKDWLLITAEKDSKVNMMTASWGQVGIMWNKPVVNIFIRESRFTKGFIDNGEIFSLCVLPESLKNVHSITGSKSGRDMDKVKETGLTVEHDGEIPYFSESRLIIECKKLFQQEMPESAYIDKNIFNEQYKNGNLHTQYIAEITKILIK